MFELIYFIILILCGFFFGRWKEAKHYKSIKNREKQYLTKPLIPTKHILNKENIQHSELAVGSVVISVDYFKTIISSIQTLFGGEVHSMSSLVDRGRREAMLRMVESMPSADAYYNVKIETSSISKSSNSQNNVTTVEVMAYGTAVHYRK